MWKKRITENIKKVERIRQYERPSAKEITKEEKQNIFRKNLEDSFGRKEVEEAVRILGSRNDNPELAKLFYKPGESLQDEMVNLLEARYMGSTRLQAHPLSFNRRGPGAADRYLKLNETAAKVAKVVSDVQKEFSNLDLSTESVIKRLDGALKDVQKLQTRVNVLGNKLEKGAHTCMRIYY